MPRQLRILVLTSSTGGGHDARAKAFAEWCFALYRHQVDVRIEQMLEKSSVVNRTGVNIYNWIQVKLPFLHNGFYAFVELLSFLNRRSVSLGRGYYRDVLTEYKPHLVLSVHDCLNRGYFQFARQVLGADKVRCATYCGEFSGGWGYSRNWIEPTVDLYISRTPTARDFAVKCGIPTERALVRGHLMRPSATKVHMNAAQRARYRVKKLGLHADRFTVFLATGSNGANNHLVLLEALRQHADKLQVIVICGRNQECYNMLAHWRTQHADLPLYLEGYTDIMHELVIASDVIVTRGGTTTCAKSLHVGCPIIFNAFGGIMPQEKLTWKFFRNGAGSQKIESGDDFAKIIDQWMANPKTYTRYRDDFLSLQYPDDQTELIGDLVGLAEAAAGWQAERQSFPPAKDKSKPAPTDDPIVDDGASI
ncbi:glycosyltransferase [Actomonas aquatica]|uniref:Glycosyltransferase n=1 Tax=Actomonas aquatica TaxID=2866162 RepID=A0ABZ1CAH5_9BACT|nr:glycosyltransferase [Opitutus sp. WL0086]WRQ88536.1 glycosyltransferase [Opitutus sp. WL0086]